MNIYIRKFTPLNFSESSIIKAFRPKKIQGINILIMAGT